MDTRRHDEETSLHHYHQLDHTTTHNYFGVIHTGIICVHECGPISLTGLHNAIHVHGGGGMTSVCLICFVPSLPTRRT